jgi:hypothetical protein
MAKIVKISDEPTSAGELMDDLRPGAENYPEAIVIMWGDDGEPVIRHTCEVEEMLLMFWKIAFAVTMPRY